MRIPIVLKDGRERTVRKDELQYLIASQKVMFFERSDGWAVPGRDRMRLRQKPYPGEDQRDHVAPAKDLWY